MVDKTAHVLDQKTTFFFGADPSSLGQLLVPAAANLAANGRS